MLIFIRLQTRQVYLAGITPHPTDARMRQMARNVTMAEVGFLNGWVQRRPRAVVVNTSRF